MFTRKKKGTMLAKRAGTANQRQIVKGTDEVSPRTLAKRGEAADPSKVARLVLERIETFPETYYQGAWLGKRKKGKGGSMKRTLAEAWLEINNLPSLSASEWSDCGSTGCVAGHTSAVAVELGLLLPTSPTPMTPIHMKDVARKALKLKKAQAAWLFEWDRSLGEVKTALNLIISGKSKKIPKNW